MSDIVGNFVESWMSVYLIVRRSEKGFLFIWAAGGYGFRRNNPNAYSFASSGVDVARIFDGYFGIWCMKAAYVFMT